MSSQGRALPGFESPAADFEQPYEMLEACHERLQRTLNLLLRLISHVQQQGHDAQSRSAAADVLRYFDLAAPQHHLDEERHVFPRMLAQGTATQITRVQQLQREHREMEGLWAELRPMLQDWRDAPTPSLGALPEASDLAHRFAMLYTRHLRTEEDEVFPAAQALTPAQAIAPMGDEMRARRQA